MNALTWRISIKKFLASVVLIILLLVLSRSLSNANGLIFSCVTLLLSAVLFGPISFTVAKGQYKRFIIFQESGRLKSHISGIFIRSAIAIPLSIFGALLVILMISELTDFAWFLIFSSLLAYSWVHSNFVYLFKKEHKYPFSILSPVAFAKVIMSAALAMMLVIADLSGISVLNTVADVKSNLFQEMISAASLIGFSGDYLVELMLASEIPFWAVLGALLFVIRVFSTLYLLFSLMDWVYIPVKEFNKVVMPIKVFDTRDIEPKSYLFWTSGIFSFLTLTLWIPFFANVEFNLKNRPVTQKILPITTELRQLIDVAVELIAGEYYQPGTIAAVQVLEEQFFEAYDDSEYRIKLKREIEKSFDQIETNTDLFLDQYYSLSADYIRMGATATGGLEQYVSKQLTDALLINKPFAKVVQLEKFEQQNKENFLDRKREILSEINVMLQSKKVIIAENEIAQIVMTKETLVRDLDISKLNFELNDTKEMRWGASVGGGAISGLIMKKLTAKGTIKLLTTGLTKKFGAKALGGVIGGTIGSVVPGAGTLFGATFGTLLGVSFDYVSLKWSEARHRDELKDQIVSVIRAQENRVLQDL